MNRFAPPTRIRNRISIHRPPVLCPLCVGPECFCAALRATTRRFGRVLACALCSLFHHVPLWAAFLLCGASVAVADAGVRIVMVWRLADGRRSNGRTRRSSWGCGCGGRRWLWRWPWPGKLDRNREGHKAVRGVAQLCLFGLFYNYLASCLLA